MLVVVRKLLKKYFRVLYFFFYVRCCYEKFLRICVLFGQLSLKWMGIIKRSVKFTGVINLP